jgi:hypothetical protein
VRGAQIGRKGEVTGASALDGNRVEEREKDRSRRQGTLGLGRGKLGEIEGRSIPPRKSERCRSQTAYVSVQSRYV